MALFGSGESGWGRLKRAVSRNVEAAGELPGKLGGGTSFGTKVLDRMAGGAATVVNIPARIMERQPWVAAILGVLGVGALASHFLSGPAPARTEDGLTPEEAGRALARERLIDADNAAQRDVGMAVEAMQQRAALMGAPEMAGAMPPSRMIAGPTTMVGGGSYQGRMQAPLEQNVSM